MREWALSETLSLLYLSSTPFISTEVNRVYTLSTFKSVIGWEKLFRPILWIRIHVNSLNFVVSDLSRDIDPDQDLDTDPNLKLTEPDPPYETPIFWDVKYRILNNLFLQIIVKVLAGHTDGG